MSNDLRNTIGNEAWMRANEGAIKKLLPDVWTHMDNLNGLQLGCGLKLLGIPWYSIDEFGRIMLYLEKIGILQRQNGFQVRANPGSIFK